MAALGIVVAVAVAIGLQWAHFVGATDDGRLAVYQGLPFDITADLPLYRAVSISDIRTDVLSTEERRALLDHRLGSLDSAQARVDGLMASSPWLRTPPSTP